VSHGLLPTLSREYGESPYKAKGMYGQEAYSSSQAVELAACD
jgi:hypothetical protein